MSARNIRIVYRKELTEWLRDRRTLISTVLVPLLLFPLLVAGMGASAAVLMDRAEKETAKIMVLGGGDSPEVLQGLRALGAVEVVPLAPDWKEQIANKQIRAAVAVPEGFQASLASGEAKTVNIYFYEGEIKSSFGAGHVEKYFKDYRDRVIAARLAAKKLPETILKPFEVKRENVAPPEKVGGAAIGGFIGYLVILLCMTGAMYPAIDLTAGEKERGTMETILTSAVSRLDIVLGKFLLVLSASLATATLSVISMAASFAGLGRFHSFGGRQAAELNLQIGIKSAATVFLMALPVAVLFSAALITIALFARSHKEAQSYITPLMVVVIVPAVASLLPGVELTAKLALIPILNTSLVCKEIVTGTYHWPLIALIFASTGVYAAAALFMATKMFQRESVLFRS